MDSKVLVIDHLYDFVEVPRTSGDEQNEGPVGEIDVEKKTGYLVFGEERHISNIKKTENNILKILYIKKNQKTNKRKYIGEG